MPRSSRHKSSKHSSREATEYSDSEKDSSLKERKGKEESGGVRASKDFGSNEKRKLDLKDGKESHGGSGNGEYSEDYISLKRRKDRSDGRASDRWNGGEDDYYGRGEGPKKSSKASGDSKSKRKDDSVGTYEEREELKKNSSSGKGEGRHRDRDLTRKEGRESGGVERDKEKERERKSTDGRSERLGSNDHRGAPKQVFDNTDLNAHVDVGSPELHNQMERQTRKRRDGSLDADKYEDDVGDTKGRRLSSRDDSGKDGRLKDEKHKDERYKDKQHEDLDGQRDDRLAKDYHPSSRSEDKQFRNEKDTEEMFQKRSKLKDSERKVENAHDYDHGRNRDSELRDRDRERDRGRSRGHDHDRDWDHDYDLDHDRDRNRDRRRDRLRDHDREHDRDRDRDHDYDREYGGPRHDDRAVRYRDTSRGRRGSPDGQDDINDSQSRSIKACFSDMENKPSTGDRNVLEVSKGRSQSWQAYSDKSSNKWRTSPSSNSHTPLDDSRNMNPEDFKYKDSTTEQRPKAVPPRDVSVPPGLSERGNKYKSTEKSTKTDDHLLGELSYERSSSFKASPLATVERSPSPPSIERRCVKRSVARRSLDIEETGQRGGADFRINEDRPSRDLLTEKPDNSSPADSSFYNRSNQGTSSSLVSPRPGFRVGLGSPSFIGSLEDDGRVNSNARYRRSSDPNMGRAHGNAWRGVPNWASPVPNGFIPFQHGPPSGGFQGMMPQFPGTLFGVRPSMEINHSGMPYHMADAERFSSHLRPLGWHNIMDGSGPSHVHGWDGSNAFREEPHIYGTAEWDQNRHPFSGHGWESSTEMWKGQNGEAKRDMPSPSHKDDYPVPVSEDDVGQAGQFSNNNDSYNQGYDESFAEKRSSVTSPVEESTPKNINEKTHDHSESRRNDVSHLSSYYLSKIDISAELVHPEVYNQCMNLLGTQQNTTVDDDTNMHIILQHDSRAGLKASNSLWISSHFPLREGVFKRAMGLYEKQRLETRCTSFLKEGMLEDPILASNQANMEEQVDHNIEKVEDQVITKDEEVRDSPIPTIDQKDIETVSSAVAEDKLGEFLSAPAKEPDRINLLSPKLEESVQYHNQEEPGETEPKSCEEEMEAISSELVKLGKVDAKGVASVNTAPPIATPLAIGDNFIGIGKTNGGHSLSCDEEGMSFADAMRVPLCIPSGSPMACEGMISESNESVILSRIHHSPESTH